MSNSDCSSQQKRLVPLRKVVSAAILDSYSQIGMTEQTYSHWASRGLKKLQNEVLKQGIRHVMLTVNCNTNTATLPPDFNGETFIGVVNHYGMKVPLKLNSDIALHKMYVDTIAADDRCDKCSQPKSICNDLEITEEVNFITINGVAYEEKIVKKLYPNGDYFLEKTTPVLSLADNAVTNTTTKEFITNLDLKGCGCLEESEDNMCKLRSCCPDTYCCYYAGCDNGTQDGGYRIFDEQGLIQFDYGFKAKEVYIEYVGFMPKVNGQYQVPEVAFETLVEWTKFKSVENRRSVPLSERNWFFQNYVRERRNMEKILGRINLSVIIDAIGLTPKFNINNGRNWYDCFTQNKALADHEALPSEDTAATTTTSVVRTEGETIVFVKKQFTIGQTGSLMVEGDTVLTINEAYIKTNSVNVVLNTQTLNEGQTDEISYTVGYNPNSIIITFNQGAVSEQKYTISYAKIIV